MFWASDSAVRLLLMGTNIHTALPETHRATRNSVLVSDPCIFLGNIYHSVWAQSRTNYVGTMETQLCHFQANFYLHYSIKLLPNFKVQMLPCKGRINFLDC